MNQPRSLNLRAISRISLTQWDSPARPTFETSPEAWNGQATGAPLPVIVVGAGMTGLTVANDLAKRGVPCVLLDDSNTTSSGSRSISQAKRSLEIWDRLEVAHDLQREGVAWSSGHVYCSERHLLSFNLQPDAREKFPAFINMPQWRIETLLVNAAQRSPLIDLRWNCRVNGLIQDDECVTLQVQTPQGPRELAARWVVAADGVRSSVRQLLGADFEGGPAGGRFLIADVRLGIDMPPERHFWFNPTFHDGNCVLLHRQPQGIWRLDWEIGADADPEAERAEDKVRARIQRMFGADVPIEIVWVSVYRFEVRRTESFRRGRVLMAGDAAHQLSPFGGGRGGNSGVQDADNLGWKLASVINGLASSALLETYGVERQAAADENMLISRRSSRFIVPDTPAATALRNSVLQACGRVKGVEAYLNTGRLSTANRLPEGTFARPASRSGQAASRVGMVITDAPITGFGTAQWLSEIIGEAFCLLVACDKDSTIADAIRAAEELRHRRACPVTLVCVVSTVNQWTPCRGTVMVQDSTGLLRERYGLLDGTWYIIRPDSYVVGHGECLDVQAICDAVDVTTNGAYVKSSNPTVYGT